MSPSAHRGPCKIQEKSATAGGYGPGRFRENADSKEESARMRVGFVPPCAKRSPRTVAIRARLRASTGLAHTE